MAEPLQLLKDVLFLRPPFAMEAAMFLHTIKGAMHVRAQGPQYWVAAIISVVFACFSGGTVAPILIGRVTGPLANDLIVPYCVVAWYITHHFGGFFYNILSKTPIRLVYGAVSDIYRAIGIFKHVDLALSIIPASKFYPIPIFGPILLGTISGCFALFMPLDKGLSAFKFGTPVPVQTAFFMATVYHFMVNDEHFIGSLFRTAFGTWDRETVQMALIAFGIAFGVITTLFGPHANPFTPFHKFFYLVFQTQGPENPNKDKPGSVGWDLERRHLLRRVLDAGRVLAVVAGILFHFYLTSPPTSLAAGTSLVPGERIGVCQFMAPYRNCVPYSFTLENDGSLFVYYGTKKERGTSQIMWQQKPATPAQEGDKVSMEFGNDGVLRVYANDQLLQQFPETVQPIKGDAVPELHVHELTGKPYVTVGDQVHWKA